MKAHQIMSQSGGVVILRQRGNRYKKRMGMVGAEEVGER